MQIFLLFRSSIGQKILMALSGLLYIGFLVAHLGGNFLLYKGRDAFNIYSDKFTSTNLIYVAEAVLILALLVHVWTAMSLTRKNRIAKGRDYQKQLRKRIAAFIKQKITTQMSNQKTNIKQARESH